MSVRRPVTAALATLKRAPRVRSALTNGSKLLPGIDADSAIGRRLQDLIDLLSAECGAVDELTLLDVRAAAMATVEHEGLQARKLAGDPVSQEELTRAANAAARARNALRRSRAARKPNRAGRARLQALADSVGEG